MTRKSEIQAQIAALQTELAALNRAPSDTFSFGTVVVFSPATGAKWYVVKTADETWKSFQDGTSKDLASWIAEGLESNVGYFEVYTMAVSGAPIFASA